MKKDKEYLKIIEHYERCLEKHGDSHLGVDWPKIEDVETRYHVMLGVIKEGAGEEISLLDFGCGLSHLYEYIIKNNIKNIEYSGLDISEKFINLSKKKFPQNIYYCLDVLENPELMPSVDYVVMNGVFTEKRELAFEEMFRYFKNLLSIAFSRCRKGLAFNVMSKAVDWERDDLFYLSLGTLDDFVAKNLTRSFAIRHDYGLYEYTVYLYK